MRNPEREVTGSARGVKPFLIGGVIAIGLAAVSSLHGLYQSRASAESSGPGNLHGHGYDVDTSSLGPNIVRITGRSTLFPLRLDEESKANGINRLEKICGKFTPLEDALEKTQSERGGIVVYGEVANRLACMGQ